MQPIGGDSATRHNNTGPRLARIDNNDAAPNYPVGAAMPASWIASNLTRPVVTTIRDAAAVRTAFAGYRCRWKPIGPHPLTMMFDRGRRNCVALVRRLSTRHTASLDVEWIAKPASATRKRGEGCLNSVPVVANILAQEN